MLGISLIIAAATATATTKVPANGWITFASKRQDGRREVYLMKADGTNIQRLTYNGGEDPKWSPDGAWISYQQSDIGPAFVVRWDKSQHKMVHQGQPIFWMLDGSGLVTRVGNDHYLVDPDTMKTKLLFKRDDFLRMKQRNADFVASGISRDGRWLIAATDLYSGGNTGDNGTFDAVHAVVLLDFQNPKKVYYVGSGCGAVFPKVGDWVYHVHDIGSERDIYRLKRDDLAKRTTYKPEVASPSSEWGYEYFPSISNDGQWMVYGASTGCHDHNTCDYEIFVHKLGTGPKDRTRVTFNNANDRWPSLYIGEMWQRPTKPLIKLTEKKLTFETDGGEPEVKVQEVHNIGPGTLQAVKTRVTYKDGAGDWLKIELTNSGNVQKLKHTVTSDQLAAGSYEATVTVQAANASNTVSYVVTLAQNKTDTIGDWVDDPEAEGGCSIGVGGVPSPHQGVGALLLSLLVLCLVLGRRRA